MWLKRGLTGPRIGVSTAADINNTGDDAWLAEIV
jgi:hypothetical protein